SSRRRHTRSKRDWSSDVCSSDLFVRAGHFTVHSSATPGTWMDAVLVLMFAFGGFEGALIPMSEAHNPRRDAPFALFAALAMTTRSEERRVGKECRPRCAPGQ